MCGWFARAGCGRSGAAGTGAEGRGSEEFPPCLYRRRFETREDPYAGGSSQSCGAGKKSNREERGAGEGNRRECAGRGIAWGSGAALPKRESGAGSGACDRTGRSFAISDEAAGSNNGHAKNVGAAEDGSTCGGKFAERCDGGAHVAVCAAAVACDAECAARDGRESAVERSGCAGGTGCAECAA